MEGIELISFQIISSVGSARSSYIEAIQLAKQNKIVEARKMIKEGENFFTEGHHAHAQLIQQEASGEPTSFSLILIHAEDQLMSAEAFKIIATEFIDVYEKIK
ncbi:PTS lactose/cellobiose transporter subunit IIA [Enterococcus thailandicus]|uniref:PTS lactose/cellobiose transporter subunit IIA n=1 Tax=Enterococcus thailandicus TaxID=417368 RepID=UPI0022E97B99|nr:PTS lactose/cellobiose transporter subunit IIA [Enterococcus thailandicus]